MITNFSQLKIGVIGFGSIGKRHCANLLELGVKDIVLLRDKSKGNDYGLEEIYNIDDFFLYNFDFVIISNPTAFHFDFLKPLINRNQNLIVEKPIAATENEYFQLKELLKSYQGHGLCAYNLRFHPAIKKVKELLDIGKAGRIYSARFFVGQYLPDWRPNTNYRDSYSSKSELGGGVILDLSHEIDLAYYLFGEVKSNFHSITTKLSNLDINTEDISEVHYQTENNSIISIHLDYLVQGYSRHFEVIGETAQINCDLFTNEIKVIGKNNEIIEIYNFDNFTRNDMYIEMLKYYLNHFKEYQILTPNLLDGLYTLKIALGMKHQINIYE